MKITDKRASSKYSYIEHTMNKSVDEESYSSEDLETKDSTAAAQEIIARVRKFADSWYAIENDNISNFRDDMRFLYGDQWTADLRSARSMKNKPVLQCNMVKTYVDLMLGEEIQNDPDLIVSAIDHTVPQEEVDLREGIIRQASYENKLSKVKLETFMYMLSGGWGVIEAGYDYISPKSFEKKLTAESTDDCIMYFFDPYAKSMFKDDGDISGKIIKLTLSEYYRYYPQATSKQSFNVQQYDSEYAQSLFHDKQIYLCECFIKEYYEETIVLLSNGESMVKEDAEELLKEQDSISRQFNKHEKMGAIVPEKLKQKIRIVEEDTRVCHRIMHYVMNGAEILDWSEWPSTYLPYIYVPCFLARIDGQKRAISYHHYAQDPQRYLNYLMSESAEIIMTGHHKNWMAPVDCFPGNLQDLLLNPQNSSPAMMYKPGPNGEKPEYVPPPQLSPAFESQFTQGVNNIMNILGKYEASRGQQGNERTGVAIDKRAAFGNMASTGPYENLNLALELLGNIWLSLVPAVYDIQRIISIRGQDDKEKRMHINQPYGMNDIKYDMSKDSFKCTIKAGVNFEAQRQARAQWLMQLTSGNPQAMMLLGDLIAEEMDFENVNKIVDRINMMQLGYPIPQIIAKETGEKPAPSQPNPQMMEQQQKNQAQQQDFALRQQQLKNDQDKIALQSQDMVQDAIRDHAKNTIDVLAMNKKIQADTIKANAEVERAKMDRHVDLVKHFSGLSHQQKATKSIV